MKVRYTISLVFGSFLYFALFSGVSAIQPSFSDVSLQSPYFEHIEYLKRNKIILGFSDGTFGVNKVAKRGEFLKVLIGALHDRLIFINTESPMPLFSDVKFSKDAWFIPYVVTAKIDQIMQGNKDGAIQLNKEMTRAEAVVFITRVLGYQAFHFKDVKLPYRDAKNLEWYTSSLRIAFQQNLLVARGFNFYPNKTITRPEMAELLYRGIVQKQKREKIKKQAVFSARLTAQNGDSEEMPKVLVDAVEPYKEGERATDLISSSSTARPDLVITNVTSTGPGDGIYQGALKITVENAGKAAVEQINFCVMAKQSWYNYKPGFNSSICTAAFTDFTPILYPGNTFIFYVWGECGQTYHKTSEVLFKVDGDEALQESDELNNEYTYQCEQ